MRTSFARGIAGLAAGFVQSCSRLGLALLLSFGLFGTTHAQTTDRWGMSARDWQVMIAPDIRQRLGFPGAAQRVLAAAQQGDAKAMAVISGAYVTGAGLTRNPGEAMRWARAAAQAGDPFGQYVLALFYVNGTGGVQVDLAEARRLLTLASDGGNARAASVLTDFYIGGSGHAVNYSMAARYARLAAEAEIPGYAYQYGLLNLPGYGATIDFDESLRWLRRSCEAGDAKGCSAASALDLQMRVLEGDTAKGLFISTWGRGTVAARTDSAFPELPCVTHLGVARNGSFPSFEIDWTRTTTRRTAANTLVFEGAVQVGDDVRERLVIFERDGGEEAIAKLDALQRMGRLNSMCQVFANGY